MVLTQREHLGREAETWTCRHNHKRSPEPSERAEYSGIVSAEQAGGVAKAAMSGDYWSCKVYVYINDTVTGPIEASRMTSSTAPEQTIE